jgi:predicted SnoaL-like aldol condensation-catalyzing enzyme
MQPVTTSRFLKGHRLQAVWCEPCFDVLFNKRDFVGAEKSWSPNYIQRSSHIEPGRDGWFNLVKSLPHGSKGEHGIMMAAGDYEMSDSRYSNPDASAIVVIDIMRIKDGGFGEHGDVIQPEATGIQKQAPRVWGQLPAVGVHIRSPARATRSLLRICQTVSLRRLFSAVPLDFRNFPNCNRMFV